MFFAGSIRSILRGIFPSRPLRKYQLFRLHLFAAGFAGTLATIVFLLFYYVTLGALPVAYDSWTLPHTLYPTSTWAYRLDLTQFLGSFVDPPWPTAHTWWIGLVLLFGSLVGAGVAYALVLSWDLTSSSAAKGMGWGVLLWITMGFAMWVANGIQPAVMRTALPDVGFFFLGWSGWACLQVLVAFLLYGAVLGAIYRRLAF